MIGRWSEVGMYLAGIMNTGVGVATVVSAVAAVALAIFALHEARAARRLASLAAAPSFSARPDVGAALRDGQSCVFVLLCEVAPVSLTYAALQLPEPHGDLQSLAHEHHHPDDDGANLELAMPFRVGEQRRFRARVNATDRSRVATLRVVARGKRRSDRWEVNVPVELPPGRAIARVVRPIKP